MTIKFSSADQQWQWWVLYPHCLYVICYQDWKSLKHYLGHRSFSFSIVDILTVILGLMPMCAMLADEIRRGDGQGYPTIIAVAAGQMTGAYLWKSAQLQSEQGASQMTSSGRLVLGMLFGAFVFPVSYQVFAVPFCIVVYSLTNILGIPQLAAGCIIAISGAILLAIVHVFWKKPEHSTAIAGKNRTQATPS